MYIVVYYLYIDIFCLCFFVFIIIFFILYYNNYNYFLNKTYLWIVYFLCMIFFIFHSFFIIIILIILSYYILIYNYFQICILLQGICSIIHTRPLYVFWIIEKKSQFVFYCCSFQIICFIFNNFIVRPL